MKTYVVVDLETTGFHALRDQIIEIALIRCTERDVLEEFSSLVCCGRSVPEFVSLLTGITDEDLIVAPQWSSLVSKISDFVGSDPIVGHSVEFDLAFLKNNGVMLSQPSFDTFTLSTILDPGLSSYKLTHLAYEYGFHLSDAHRALDDARATASVFQKLLSKLRTLPLSLIEYFASLRHRISGQWMMGHLLEYMEISSAETQGSMLFPSNFVHNHLDTSFFTCKKDRVRFSAPSDISKQALANNKRGQTLCTKEKGQSFVAFKGQEKNDSRNPCTVVSSNTTYCEVLTTFSWGLLEEYMMCALHAREEGPILFVFPDVSSREKGARLLKKHAVEAERLHAPENILCGKALQLFAQNRFLTDQQATYIAKMLVLLTSPVDSLKENIRLVGEEEYFWEKTNQTPSLCGMYDCSLLPFQSCDDSTQHRVFLTTHDELYAFIPYLCPAFHIHIIEGENWRDKHYQKSVQRADFNEVLDNLNTLMGKREKREKNQQLSFLKEENNNPGLLQRMVFALRRNNVEDRELFETIRLLGDVMHRIENKLQFVQERTSTIIMIGFHEDLKRDGVVFLDDFSLEQKKMWEDFVQWWKERESTFLSYGEYIQKIKDFFQQDQLAPFVKEECYVCAEFLRTAFILVRQIKILVEFMKIPTEDYTHALSFFLHDGQYLVSCYRYPLSLQKSMDLLLKRVQRVTIAVTSPFHNGSTHLHKRLLGYFDGTISETDTTQQFSCMICIPRMSPHPHDDFALYGKELLSLLTLQPRGHGTLILLPSLQQVQSLYLVFHKLLGKGISIALNVPYGKEQLADMLLQGTLSEVFVLAPYAFLAELLERGPIEWLDRVVITKIPFASFNDPAIISQEKPFHDGFTHFLLPHALTKTQALINRSVALFSKSKKPYIVIPDGRLLTKSYGEYIISGLKDIGEVIHE